MAIDVLLIGSGGREHALAWKIAQSPELGTLWAAPGNPGIARCAAIVALDPNDHEAVVRFCRERAIDLVVVGPEAPLVAGLADVLRAAGVPVFGPSVGAARLEGSKGFTKDLCTLRNVPTAAYGRFSDADSANAYVAEVGVPIVVKADGLMSGKGVTVAETIEEAEGAIDGCFAGEAKLGTEVVVEEFLRGEEASLFCLCDGTRAVVFGTAEDHKRAFDGDRGPNTGGMGACSPASSMTSDLVEAAMTRIVRPTLEGMQDAGTPFSGVLYAGLIITADGPKLIEYNVRFGDPECQTLMMRLKSDLLPMLLAVARGDIDAVQPEWRSEAAVCVVIATEGYPGAYPTGGEIRHLPDDAHDAVVFHAGTRRENGRLVANGGRVLGVTALGADVATAARRAYETVAGVDWPNGFYRSDIGRRAILRQG